MKQICIFIITTFVLSNVANSTSIIVTSPEHNIRSASLIVEGEVIDIWYEESKQGVPFALMRLQVKDHIVGDSPEDKDIYNILMRRMKMT